MADKIYEAKIDFGDDATGTHEKTAQTLAWLKSHYGERFPGIEFIKDEKGKGYTVKLGGRDVGTCTPLE